MKQIFMSRVEVLQASFFIDKTTIQTKINYEYFFSTGVVFMVAFFVTRYLKLDHMLICFDEFLCTFKPITFDLPVLV
jgi:hypothetical protein